MKVVCVRTVEPDSYFDHIGKRWGVTFPTIGETYEVRDTIDRGRSRVYYLLAGLNNPVVRYPGNQWAEAGFPHTWFREVTKTSTTTDISTWIGGADPASEQFDNRRKQREYTE